MKGKKNMIAGVMTTHKGHHVSICRITMTTGKVKETHRECVSTLKEVADLLESKGVSLAVVDTLFAGRAAMLQLKEHNDYTREVIYLASLIAGHTLFTVDHKDNNIFVGAAGITATLETFCGIAARVKGRK